MQAGAQAYALPSLSSNVMNSSPPKGKSSSEFRVPSSRLASREMSHVHGSSKASNVDTSKRLCDCESEFASKCTSDCESQCKASVANENYPIILRCFLAVSFLCACCVPAVSPLCHNVAKANLLEVFLSGVRLAPRASLCPCRCSVYCLMCDFDSDCDRDFHCVVSIVISSVLLILKPRNLIWDRRWDHSMLSIHEGSTTSLRVWRPTAQQTCRICSAKCCSVRQPPWSSPACRKTWHAPISRRETVD